MKDLKFWPSNDYQKHTETTGDSGESIVHWWTCKGNVVRTNSKLAPTLYKCIEYSKYVLDSYFYSSKTKLRNKYIHINIIEKTKSFVYFILIYKHIPYVGYCPMLMHFMNSLELNYTATDDRVRFILNVVPCVSHTRLCVWVFASVYTAGKWQFHRFNVQPTWILSQSKKCRVAVNKPSINVCIYSYFLNLIAIEISFSHKSSDHILNGSN